MTEIADSEQMPDMCGFAMEYVPNRRERFWRAMGYHSNHPELPPEADVMLGWVATDIRVHLDIFDRMRLLVSGKAMIRIRTATDAKFDHAISVSTFEVVPPYERQS